ncbi:hypothetical protein Taro_023029 [Colocasia esculenta]|uniref:Uncharacterized protein n=1 Tax=Colocasia esculenta TaxID=4460 RepID=A0A843V3I6_COLES|nr:hypothetical protein [Colocasia esculenta]
MLLLEWPPVQVLKRLVERMKQDVEGIRSPRVALTAIASSATAHVAPHEQQRSSAGREALLRCWHWRTCRLSERTWVGGRRRQRMGREKERETRQERGPCGRRPAELEAHHEPRPLPPDIIQEGQRPPPPPEAGVRLPLPLLLSQVSSGVCPSCAPRAQTPLARWLHVVFSHTSPGAHLPSLARHHRRQNVPGGGTAATGVPLLLHQVHPH